MRIAHTAKVMFSEFLSFCPRGGGGSGQMHYSANTPGNENILATKVLMPWGGGHMHYLANVAGNEHILATKVLMPLGGGAYALFG